jgi:hypothetical protein
MLVTKKSWILLQITQLAILLKSYFSSLYMKKYWDWSLRYVVCAIVLMLIGFNNNEMLSTFYGDLNVKPLWDLLLGMWVMLIVVVDVINANKLYNTNMFVIENRSGLDGWCLLDWMRHMMLAQSSWLGLYP